MKASSFFIPMRKTTDSTLREAHSYMIRSGMISMMSSGFYSWLPLGMRVLDRIQNLAKRHHEKAGFALSSFGLLADASDWKTTGRYTEYGNTLFKLSDRHSKEYIALPTHEEQVARLVKQSVFTKKDLPILMYQVAPKFRDELRPRFGVVRSREFIMCDGYALHATQDEAHKFYHSVKDIYVDFFNELELPVQCVLQNDTAEMGGDLSHEFLLPSTIGEDTVSVNGVEKSALELGHIFALGTKYTQALDVSVNNVPLFMSSYGIGISRLVPALIEYFGTKTSMRWPAAIAPFKFAILNVMPNNPDCVAKCDALYRLNTSECYYDDRDISYGEKIAMADLIGMPNLIVVGKNEVESGCYTLVKSGVRRRVSKDCVEELLSPTSSASLYESQSRLYET